MLSEKVDVVVKPKKCDIKIVRNTEYLLRLDYCRSVNWSNGNRDGIVRFRFTTHYT